MTAHKFFTLFSIVLIFILFHSLLFSESPIKWGEIPKADLEMKSFPQDSNATAVILYDYGESHFTDDLDIKYSRHVRIKILTPKGYKWGTFSININTHKSNQRIYDIEGITYFIDEQNRIARAELKKSDIYEEKIEDGEGTRYKFTLPALQPNCVVEVRYYVVSKYHHFKSWTFQWSEPALWSEYCICYPKNFTYTTVTQGFEPFTIAETKVVAKSFSKEASYLLNGRNNVVSCIEKRWVMQNVPAMRDEPFVAAITDYMNKVNIQLSSYDTGRKEEKVRSDWPTLIKELTKVSDFGDRITESRAVREKANELTSGIFSPADKIKKIYDWTAKSIVCTGIEGFTASKDAGEVMESRKGSHAEINFLLMSLLKSAGFNPEPVILSTRDNGKIQEVYPIVSQFNYVIARITAGNQTFYLDATDPLRPMELLPTTVLNVPGLVVRKDTVEWVRLSSQKRHTNNSLVNIALDGSGSVNGYCEDVYRDYGSLNLKRGSKDKKDIDIAKEVFESEQNGLTLDSVVIHAKDSIFLPLRINAQISSSTYAQCNGDFIYFNPHIIHRLRDNPFKSKNRKFPVDFAHGRGQTSLFNITIPEDFEVKETPKNKAFSIGQNMATYSRRLLVDSTKIQVMRSLDIRQIEFDPPYYDQLIDFYAQIIAAEAEQFVFVRRNKPASVKK